MEGCETRGDLGTQRPKSLAWPVSAKAWGPVSLYSRTQTSRLGEGASPQHYEQQGLRPADGRLGWTPHAPCPGIWFSLQEWPAGPSSLQLGQPTGHTSWNTSLTAGSLAPTFPSMGLRACALELSCGGISEFAALPCPLPPCGVSQAQGTWWVYPAQRLAELKAHEAQTRARQRTL